MVSYFVQAAVGSFTPAAAGALALMISVACEMPFYGTGECNMLSKKSELRDTKALVGVFRGITPGPGL